MNRLPCIFLKFFILATPAFCTNSVLAQRDLDTGRSLQFKIIEQLIQSKTKLTDVEHKLDSLRIIAISQHDHLFVARALNELMNIRDKRSEDSAYFRNSAFLDTLITMRGNPALRSIAFVMRAQRLSKFNTRYLRFNAANYRTKDLQHDYAALSKAERDSLASNDLDSAFRLKIGPEKGYQLLWLSSNPDVFLFDASFEDLVLSERVNLALKNRIYQKWDQQVGQLLDLSSRDFSIAMNSLSSGSSTGPDVITAYRVWMNFNSGHPELETYIESLLRKYIFSNFSRDSLSREYYKSYLKKAVESPYPMVQAHAVYQLCLILNEDGKQYARQFEPFYSYGPRSQREYFRLAPANALDLFEQHKVLMQQYPVFNRILTIMATQVKETYVKVEMDDVLLPGSLIRLRVIYKNADSLHFLLTRETSVGMVSDLNKAASSTANIVRESTVILPLPNDHNLHASFFKLDSLPPGFYRLTVYPTPNASGVNPACNLRFQVSNIAALNSEGTIFALDRRTGFPLQNAQIRCFNQQPVKIHLGDLHTNNLGYVKLKNKDTDSVTVIYNRDTFGIRLALSEQKIDKKIFDKEEYDDLDEYYAEESHVEIFTDRAIYRPGQTVHYKIILLTRNPRTGAISLLTRKAIGRKRLKRWFADDHAKLFLQDPFSKEVDSATININEFGSFSGSFNIPKSAATGNWSLSGIDETGNLNTGDFHVEEYKRPTIEMTMDKQQKMLQPGDAFTILLRLRALTDARLGNVPVHYTLRRSGSIPSHIPGGSVYVDDIVQERTINTSDSGTMKIDVVDALLQHINFPENDIWQYRYRIEASATDGAGETVDLDEFFDMRSRPITIDLSLSKMYDRESFTPMRISTIADFEGRIDVPVNIKVYRAETVHSVRTVNTDVDQWVYSQAEWYRWFPSDLDYESFQPKTFLVFDTVIKINGDDKFWLNKNNFVAGTYLVEATAVEGDHILGKTSRSFSVFDSRISATPVEDIDYLPYNSVKGGDRLTWLSSGNSESYTIYESSFVGGKQSNRVTHQYSSIVEHPGIRKYIYQVPQHASGEILLTRISVRNNEIFKHEQRIYIDAEAQSAPEVTIERYKKVMAPGAKETFTISIKTKNQSVVSELMTTLYDASLDKLADHHWEIPRDNEKISLPQTNWTYALTYKVSANTLPIGPVNLDQYIPGLSDENLQGAVNGLSIAQSSGLSEVVVVGYGTATRELTSSVSKIIIRRAVTLSNAAQPMIVLDGVVYQGDLSKLDPTTITEAIVLKGADAVALYGAKAAAGVLVISSKGPIVLPLSDAPVVKVRKHFNETAFFFPQVHASADGAYTFSFTMPESATEWNWKMLAHTKNARFTTLERKLQTRLNLMVQPNMPRILYQGDKIFLRSRVSNLDTNNVTGTASCKIEDAVTGEDISTLLLEKTTAQFQLAKKKSGSAAFLVHVPNQQLNPLKVTISVTGRGTADAEEHIIPILTTRIFTRKTQSFNFDRNKALSVATPLIPPGAEVFGVSLSISQKPQAAIIYALPWLANYSYNCAEQSFNKLRACLNAVQLIRTDSNAQRIFHLVAVKTDSAARNPLPDQLPAAATPWLSHIDHAAKQQRDLFNLLDTIATNRKVAEHLARLYKLQQQDGGLAWFDGGPSNADISAYVLAGFGQLTKQEITIYRPNDPQYSRFIEGLLRFIAHSTSVSTSDIHSLSTIYALSYWIDRPVLTPEITARINDFLVHDWAQVDQYPLRDQALLTISSLRFNKPGQTLYQKALEQMKNIRQLAIEDSVNGVRWKSFADAAEMGSSSEETFALLAEMLRETDDYPGIKDGLAKWVLTTREDEHWQTTISTAAAIEILQGAPGGAFGREESIHAAIENNKLDVSNNLLTGASTSFLALRALPNAITVVPGGEARNGALTYLYFANPVGADTLDKSIHITKKLFITNGANQWEALSNATTLKVGDKIRVTLNIETDLRLNFVQISDPRAAAFEPAENISGHRYTGGMSYYESVRDQGLEIFVDAVPKGESQIAYELIVAHDGTFNSGPVRLQCMYKPELAAYSSTFKITVSD